MVQSLLLKIRTGPCGLGLRSLLSFSSGNTNSLFNSMEAAKKLAARKAVDEHVRSGQVVGIGSGSTIVYAVQRLAELVSAAEITDVTCIPTSFQAKQLILENGLRLGSLESNPRLAVAIDGADEADSALTLIKGGGGCLAQEKLVASNADFFVVVADERKRSASLGTSWKYVPIEVLPVGYNPIKLAIEARYGGKCELRMAKAKAGPVVTDNGNFLLDWTFDLARLRSALGGNNTDAEVWDAVDTTLCRIAGVVDTGLFVNMANVAYFGQANGEVETVTRQK